MNATIRPAIALIKPVTAVMIADIDSNGAGAVCGGACANGGVHGCLGFQLECRRSGIAGATPVPNGATGCGGDIVVVFGIAVAVVLAVSAVVGAAVVVVVVAWVVGAVVAAAGGDFAIVVASGLLVIAGAGVAVMVKVWGAPGGVAAPGGAISCPDVGGCVLGGSVLGGSGGGDCRTGLEGCGPAVGRPPSVGTGAGVSLGLVSSSGGTTGDAGAVMGSPSGATTKLAAIVRRAMPVRNKTRPVASHCFGRCSPPPLLSMHVA